MAKQKKTRKEKAAEQSKQQAAQPHSATQSAKTRNLGQRKWHMIFLFVLAFIFYGNTLQNDFALDDSLAILGNSFTTQGFAGIDDIWTNDMFVGAHSKEFELTGGRYRPLSFTILAIEYEFFGDYMDDRGVRSHMAFVGHLTNVLLFALSGVLIYLLLLKVFRNFNEWIPLIAATLFVIHPIHTEVVANIKSMDEIYRFYFWLPRCYFFSKKVKNRPYSQQYFIYSLYYPKKIRSPLLLLSL